jgi:hypothetical protein
MGALRLALVLRYSAITVAEGLHGPHHDEVEIASSISNSDHAALFRVHFWRVIYQ